MRRPHRRPSRPSTAQTRRHRSLLVEPLESRVLFSADDQISEAILVAVGGTASGAISTNNDVDMFRFNVAAGQTIAFDIDLAAPLGLDSYIRLFNGSGTPLAFSDDHAAPGEALALESYLEYTFPSAGTYYMGVSSYNNLNYNPVTGAGQSGGTSTGGYTLALVSNVAPTIASLSDSPDPATAPATVTLTANSVADSDGTIQNVQFFRESNGSPGLQVGGDLWIATDTGSPYSTTIDTSFMAGGTYTYYAVATDNLGKQSNVVTATNTLNVVNNASISGVLWNDANNNKVKDAGEGTLTGWTVFLDQNRNQVLDGGEVQTTSGAGGVYSFSGLAGAQRYFVTHVIPAGWQQTSPGTAGQISSAATAEATGASAVVVAKSSLVPITTTGSTVPLELIESVATGPIDTKATRDLESNPLIRLTNFQADPRFSTIRGQNYSVAVLDTGIDLDHPFFGPDGPDAGTVADRIVYSWDFANGDSDASDFHGHGTNVASIVGSQGAGAPGMAPNVNIIALKVFTDAGSGNFSYVEQALQWVAANAAAYNIAAINMSLGDSGNYNAPTTAGIGIDDELAAIAAQDVMVVSAAGNSFFPFGSAQGVAYPAADPNSLAVSATWDANRGPVNWSDGARDFSTAPDRIASFSQRSTTMTDIFAPGPFSLGGNTSGGTVEQGGTSQSSPHIAGIAALAQQLAMRDLGRRLTMSEFKNLMNTSGVLINDGDDENDNVTNTGANFRRVDVFALGEAIYALAVSPNTHTVSLSHAEAAANVNFGNRDLNPGTGSISGKMFDDYDGDGALDLGEPGRAGVTVQLDLGNNGSIDATTTTNGSGDYTFSSLAAGSHTVTQVVPAGFICNLASINVILGAGQASTNNSFGEFRVVHEGTASNDAYTLGRDAGGTRIEVTAAGITWSKLATQLASTGITFNLGAGEDQLTVNYANGSPIPAFGVDYDGGTHATPAGDRLWIMGANAAETYQVFSNAVTRTGDANSPFYTSLEGITINGLGGNDTITQVGTPNGVPTNLFGDAGDDTINLQSTGTSAAVSINGGTENDTITIGNGNVGLISSAVTVQGGANIDSVVVNDSTNLSPATFTINGASVSRAGFGGLTHGTGESLTLNAGTVADVINFATAAPAVPVTVNGGNGNDTLNVNVAPTAALAFNGGLNASFTDTLNVNAGTFTFAADANAATANLQVNVTNASVVFNATQHLAGIALNGGGVATMPANGNRYLFTKNLSVNASGKLDLVDNDLLWDYSSTSVYATARQLVLNGRDNVGGVGGIAYDKAGGDVIIAPVDNAVYGKTIFNGETIDGTTIIGKYTYYGDGNLDGQVTGDDYLGVDANLGLSGAQWFQGDFNFSSSTTGDDYLAIDANLGKGTLSPLAYKEAQAEMTAIHAARYGGEAYVDAVELAAKGDIDAAWVKLSKTKKKSSSRK